MKRVAPLLTLAIGLAALAPAHVKAQACCAGALGSAGVRLRIFDTAAVQFDAAFDRELGLWDGRSTYRSSTGSTTVDLRAMASGTLRMPYLTRLELSVQLPLQLGYRAAGATTDWGGGPGDVSLAGRYTFVETGDHDWPGIGLVVGALVPTGRSALDSTGALGADITGRGSWRLGAEGWFEYQNGPLYLAAVPGLANTPLSADFGGGNEWELLGRLIVGWTLPNRVVLAGNVQVTHAPSRESNFGPVPGKGRPSATLAASLPIGESWFVQASTGADLPVSGLGTNETSLLRAQVGLRYSFVSDD